MINKRKRLRKNEIWISTKRHAINLEFTFDIIAFTLAMVMCLVFGYFGFLLAYGLGAR